MPAFRVIDTLEAAQTKKWDRIIDTVKQVYTDINLADMVVVAMIQDAVADKLFSPEYAAKYLGYGS